MSAHPIVWLEIGCRKLDVTSTFLADLFGWKTSPMGGDSTMIDTGVKEGIMGHVSAMADSPVPHYVVPYVHCDDLQASIDKAVNLGGKPMIPPTEVPGMGSFAWIMTPEDQVIGLWKPLMNQ
jgi:predicted enzyme related to lactoylglutathione lyase